MRLFKRIGYYFYSLLEMTFHFKNWLTLWPIFLKERQPEPRVVRLRVPPVRIMVRGRMDVWSVKETFLDKFYTRYGFPIDDGWTILDIGAGVGDFCIYAAYGRPNALVYAFEPFAESYQLLIQNLTLNALGNILAFQQALWLESGTLALDLSGGEPLQIISQGIHEVSKINGMQRAEAISLRDLFEEQSIDHVDLMKLDCEGAEYEILLGASSRTLEKIDRLVLETHDFGEGRNYQVLISHLKTEGYRVQRFQNPVHAELGYLSATR